MIGEIATVDNALIKGHYCSRDMLQILIHAEINKEAF